MKTLMLHDIDDAWYRRWRTQHEVDLYCVKVSIRIDNERGTCGECHLIWEAGNISGLSRPWVYSARSTRMMATYIWGSVGCREQSSRDRLAYCISSKIIRHLANAYECRTPEQVACRMHMRRVLFYVLVCCLHELQFIWIKVSPSSHYPVLPRSSTSQINFSNSLIFTHCTELWLCFILCSEKLIGWKILNRHLAAVYNQPCASRS